MINTCRIEDCEDDVKARGLCNKHYAKWLRYGDPLLVKNNGIPNKCKYKGCNEEHEAFGYCRVHYYHYKKYGDPTPKVTRYNKCVIPYCTNPHKAKGLCGNHYNVWYLTYRKYDIDLDTFKSIVTKHKNYKYFLQKYKQKYYLERKKKDG